MSPSKGTPRSFRDSAKVEYFEGLEWPRTSVRGPFFTFSRSGRSTGAGNEKPPTKSSRVRKSNRKDTLKLFLKIKRTFAKILLFLFSSNRLKRSGRPTETRTQSCPLGGDHSILLNYGPCRRRRIVAGSAAPHRSSPGRTTENRFVFSVKNLCAVLGEVPEDFLQTVVFKLDLDAKRRTFALQRLHDPFAEGFVAKARPRT